MNFSNIKSITIPQGVVKQITTSQGVVLWQAETGPTDYSKRYLTLVARDSGTLQFDGTTDGTTTNTIQYSTDNGQTWSTAAQSVTLNVSNGDKVLWKGEMVPNTSGIGNFTSSTASFDIEGNSMSLLYGDNFNDQISLSEKQYCFRNLFKQSKCINAKNLVLPATTLVNYCYYNMFISCTSLTTAPELPATTLATSCYSCMFGGCISLTTAPALSGTTLAQSCYYEMFKDCTNLTTAPSLPATSLAQSCYKSMFNSCSSLTTAPSLPATTLAYECYSLMFRSCTSLTTAPSLPATTLTDNCYNEMFYGCTSLTTAPALPATTLTTYCYSSMFQNCTSLTAPPVISATTITNYKNYSCSWMFAGCTSLTTAPELNITILKNYSFQNMFYNAENVNYIKMLSTDISASSCLSNWVSGVAATGIFVKNISASWTTTGASGVPTGWTVIYYDTTEDKYYLDQQKSQECDDHGNSI